MLVCQMLLKFVISFNDYQFQFEHWGFADWLINFEGGFVRRGILGQAILCMYKWFSIDVGQTLHIISLLSTLALIALVTALFIRRKLSVFILPTAIMLGTFAINNIITFRRDQLMLLILFLIFYFYKKICHRQQQSHQLSALQHYRNLCDTGSRSKFLLLCAVHLHSPMW